MNLTFGSLFSGIGGADIAGIAAGFTVSDTNVITEFIKNRRIK